ncbi:hypothetical protein XELAEV_18009991mg [Xenopus laevis]|uniref:GIY-YIG domain-containing protein n=1 Tax=Xenopus laevis TaxID=8355 RepID=A0A974DTQ0_XENLA|nr:hypothetical protein XELAEV_18009991mg [Xenopus laevis]
MITCLKCCKQYVGCTSRRLKERITKHLSQIKNSRAAEGSNVTRHFAKCNGGDTSFFSVQGIERVPPGKEGSILDFSFTNLPAFGVKL